MEKIESLFQRHTRFHHFYLRDLRSGQEWEFGTRRAYPMGSCFKLALLMVVFDALDAEEMERPIAILPEDHVDAGGVLKLFGGTINLTPLQLCQLILTASDATATDILIKRVGLDAVNAKLQQHAPRSHISRNLADMMRDFRAMPESTTCKQREWRLAELEEFTKRVAALGATDARALADLIFATWNYSSPPELAIQYEQCVQKVARTMARTEMYFAPVLSTFTKTGSLGYRFFVQDAGILINQKTPIAVFAHCSVGWQLPQWIVDCICGEIGLLMLDKLDIERPFSPDWTEAGSAMLHKFGQ